MKIRIHEGLPHITASLVYQTRHLVLNKVLLDTGSMSTIFAADAVDIIDLLPEPEDTIHQVRGVGGTEFVFEKRIDSLIVGALRVGDFAIEVGAMKYGFGLDGIIGLDFLLQTGAIIDLLRLDVYSSTGKVE